MHCEYVELWNNDQMQTKFTVYEVFAHAKREAILRLYAS